MRDLYGNGEGKLLGNAHFKYTYTSSNLKPLDTLLLEGLVTNVNSYNREKDQEYFLLQQFDSLKNTVVSRKILTEYIIYGKIKSLDSNDSIEYSYYAGYGWRVVKRRNDLTWLYRSYHTTVYDTYDASSGTGGARAEHDVVIKLIRNGKAIPGISSFNGYYKKTFIKFINKRYNQRFLKKDFRNVGETLDYIMDMESKKTLY
jgi:hypothetical protein